MLTNSNSRTQTETHTHTHTDKSQLRHEQTHTLADGRTLMRKQYYTNAVKSISCTSRNAPMQTIPNPCTNTSAHVQMNTRSCTDRDTQRGIKHANAYWKCKCRHTLVHRQTKTCSWSHTRAQGDKDMQLVTHSCTSGCTHLETNSHTHTHMPPYEHYSSLSFFPSPGRVKDDSRSMRGSNRGFMKHGPWWGQSAPSLQQLMSMPRLKNVPQGGRQGQCNAPKRIPPRM